MKRENISGLIRISPAFSHSFVCSVFFFLFILFMIFMYLYVCGLVWTMRWGRALQTRGNHVSIHLLVVVVVDFEALASIYKIYINECVNKCKGIRYLQGPALVSKSKVVKQRCPDSSSFLLLFSFCLSIFSSFFHSRFSHRRIYIVIYKIQIYILLYVQY